jgi:hypothetical protein
MLINIRYYGRILKYILTGPQLAGFLGVNGRRIWQALAGMDAAVVGTPL